MSCWNKTKRWCKTTVTSAKELVPGVSRTKCYRNIWCPSDFNQNNFLPIVSIWIKAGILEQCLWIINSESLIQRNQLHLCTTSIGTLSLENTCTLISAHTRHAPFLQYSALSMTYAIKYLFVLGGQSFAIPRGISEKWIHERDKGIFFSTAVCIFSSLLLCDFLSSYLFLSTYIMATVQKMAELYWVHPLIFG